MIVRIAVVIVAVIAYEARGQSLVYSSSGDSSGDICGWAVSAAGDVNRDGYSDFLVGVPGESMVRVFSGKTGTLIHTLTTSSELGRAVAPAGDIDGDLWADVYGGATADSQAGPLAGAAYVFSGFDGSVTYTFLGESAGDRAGIGGGVGDLNGDGFPDIAVGSPNSGIVGVDAGRVRAFSGRDGQLLWAINGDSAGDLFGWNATAAGDSDLDGRDDVLVSILKADAGGPDSGSVRVLSGSNGSTLRNFNGAMQGVNATTFGYSISGGGDTNGDGYADAVVGIVHDDATGYDSGSAHVYSGKDGSLLHVFAGDNPYSFLGWSVSGGSDVNADGFSDILAGARFFPAIYGPGMARAYSGKDGSVLFTISTGIVGDEFGLAVALVGDIDGNGRGDVIVGAYGDSAESGKAYVYSTAGSCGPISSFGSGCLGNGGFTPALAMTGCPSSLGTVTLTLSGATSPTMAVLVFGLGSGAAPMGGGCTLNVSPLVGPILTLNVYGSGAGLGNVSATGQLPLVTIGGSITAQAFVADQSMPIGFSATNGLSFTIP